MGVKFVDMISEAVSLSHKLPSLHERLAELSAMHIKHGVEAKHMESMGNVLLTVLDNSLDSDFTSEVLMHMQWAESSNVCMYMSMHMSE
jgi:hypothetical protein